MIDCLASDWADKYSQRVAKDYKKTHFEEILDKAPGELVELAKDILLADEVLNELMGVFKKIPHKGQDIYLGMLCRFLFSCLLDADRIDTANFENPENKDVRLNNQYPGWDRFITALEKRLSEFIIENRVDEIRQEVSIACQQAGTRERGIYNLDFRSCPEIP